MGGPLVSSGALSRASLRAHKVWKQSVPHQGFARCMEHPSRTTRPAALEQGLATGARGREEWEALKIKPKLRFRPCLARLPQSTRPPPCPVNDMVTALCTTGASWEPCWPRSWLVLLA